MNKLNIYLLFIFVALLGYVIGTGLNGEYYVNGQRVSKAEYERDTENHRPNPYRLIIRDPYNASILMIHMVDPGYCVRTDTYKFSNGNIGFAYACLGAEATEYYEFIKGTSEVSYYSRKLGWWRKWKRKTDNDN